MKRFLSIVLAALLLWQMPLCWVSCSEPDDMEQTEEKPETVPDRQPGLNIPPEMMEKIDEIYGNASTGPQRVTRVNELAILTSICAYLKGNGPITVTDVLLNDTAATLVTLGGTENVEGQATSMEEDVLAASGKDNDYLLAVTKLFEDGTVPTDKPVIVTGISLGGMVAQQLLGKQSVLDSHTIRAIITFGSPITLPVDRQGVKVVRFADMSDRVPVLGETLLRTGMLTSAQMSRNELLQRLDKLDRNERIAATSKYTDMLEAHGLSYIEDACWEATDFLGDKDKKNVLVLKESMRFYKAPKL